MRYPEPTDGRAISSFYVARRQCVKVGTVTFHAGSNTVTSSYGREFKGQEYSPGHPYYKAQVKAVPLQAWSGPEGSTKLRFPDFMTTAQDGGKIVSLTHRPYLPSGNSPGTHFC
jgi:hypothetical protein